MYWVEEENGVYAEYELRDGIVYRRKFDPNRQAKLNQNAEVRRSGTRMMDWGKMIADIPLSDLPVLRKLYGDALFNDKYDKDARRQARERFFNSSASDPYRVEERRRKIK